MTTQTETSPSSIVIETFGIVWHCPKQAAIFQRLCHQFPQTFMAQSPPKPLSLSVREGLHSQLQPLIQSGKITKSLLKKTMKTYTKSEVYLQQLMLGGSRYNLQGSPEGCITEK